MDRIKAEMEKTTDPKELNVLRSKHSHAKSNFIQRKLYERAQKENPELSHKEVMKLVKSGQIKAIESDNLPPGRRPSSQARLKLNQFTKDVSFY